MNRVLILGEAVGGLARDRDGTGVLLLDGERPAVPRWLHGAEARGLGEYRTDEISFVRAAEEANRLIRQWADARDGQERRLADVASYEGIPLWEVVEINLLYGLLAPLIDELMVWERVFDAERPVRLIVPAGPSGRIALAVARARGIPVQTREVDSPRAGLRRSVRDLVPPRLRASLRRGRQLLWRWRAGWHDRALREGSQAGAGRRILVLTVVRRFVEVVIPVIRALERDRSTSVLVVDRNFSTAVPRLEEEGIPYRIFEGYSDRRAVSRVREEERRFRREWSCLRSDQAFHHHFTRRGVDLWPLIAPTLHEYFTALFPELVRVIEVTRNLLRTERPDVVVLTDERSPFQRAFTWACRRPGVPTVAVQETIFPDLPYGSPIATDWIAVDGESERDNLVKLGTPVEKIAVTGQPRFDFIANPGPPFSRDEILGRLGLDPARPTVAVFSQYAGIYFRPEDKRRVFRAIYSGVAALPELQLVVKLHPDEPGGLVERELVAEAGLGAYRIVASGESLELVFASDLVIVFFSTVGHEAMVMDRPLIQIPAAPGEGPVVSYLEEGGALDGSRLEELPALIRAALRDPVTRDRLREGRHAYIRRHAHALDGRSSERVAELVTRAADGRRR